MLRIPIRQKLTLAILLSLLGSLGCWRAAFQDPEYDAEAALSTLTTALRAWKAGNLASLSSRSPPIRFADDDSLTGARLKDFELEDPGVQIKPFQDVKIELVLLDAQRRTIRKTVTYQVALKPALAVLRSDN